MTRSSVEARRLIIGNRGVGTIGFGTAPLAFKNVSVDQAVATVRAAVDSGVDLVDTALAYTRPGVESFAEAVVAKALGGGADVLVATKGGHRRAGDAFPVDARPASLRADCDVSLRTLGVDAIGLYQLHHVDPRVPLVESVGALEELRIEGKIGMIGLSNVDIAQIEQARTVAPIVSVQNRLSYADRDDLATAEYCGRQGIAYLAYMPLHGSGDVAAVQAVADRHGVSPQRVRLAWLLAQGTHIMALVGASRPATIVDSAPAGGLRLNDDDLRRLG
jgi:aryl-alcohol dehydrogenase-like predicted oxidoreductase